MRTPVCELLGIERPIVQAPIGSAAGPPLAAAVSEAGALGMLALSWTKDAGGPVSQTASLTKRPFGGNLVLAWDQHWRLDRALEAGLRIVSLTWGDPAATSSQLTMPARWSCTPSAAPRKRVARGTPASM